MAKSGNQKLKILYIAKILLRETDEEHGITMPQLIKLLNEAGISADRKTLYSDIEELRLFGLDITGERTGKEFSYRLVSRNFELPELKLLVDCVQAAKFISEKKSQELIRKLEALASRHEAKKLQREVIISGRVKTDNETVYYNVDRIHEAMAENSQIAFKYFRWNLKKKQELRHNGADYVVSPWHLIWDDEYYYLVAYDAAADRLKHFRVDKILDIRLTHEPREGGNLLSRADITTYSKSLFGMFGGAREKVTLVASNDMAGIFIDRFGRDIMLIPRDENHFSLTVDISVSDLFLGWIISLGENVAIVSPSDVADRMRAIAGRLSRQYK